MPKVGKEHKQSRKIQILQAAVECFGEQGFHQTSMRDICIKAELSTGAVYNYFDGKNDIIETMAKESRNSTNLLFEDINEADTREQTIQKILKKLAATLDYQKNTNQLKMKIHFWAEALRSEKVKSIFNENIQDTILKIVSQLEERDSNAKNAKISDAQVAILATSVYQGLAVLMTIAEDVNTKEYFEVLSSLLTVNNF